MEKPFIILLMSCLLMTSGCSSSKKFLNRPEETNLQFWITQRVRSEDFVDNIFLPGWFGATEYLDSRYCVADEDHPTVPDVHVTYLVAGYPDAIDNPAVVHIEITDPLINVYGLTMSSSEESILSTMLSNNFNETTLENGEKAYGKNNVSFIFSATNIRIDAPSTNRHHITY